MPSPIVTKVPRKCYYWVIEANSPRRDLNYPPMKPKMLKKEVAYCGRFRSLQPAEQVLRFEFRMIGILG